MTGAAFMWRGLWYFRASYLGVLAGAALGAMVLLGALLAGDSVKESLRQVAEARLGKVDAVLSGGDRMFRAALADSLAEGQEPPVLAAPVLLVKATAGVARSGRSLGGVQVLGVDRRFWNLAPGDNRTAAPAGREFFVNEHLARSLDLAPGETLVLRFDKPAMIARDAPLAGKAADLVALRGEVGQVCGDGKFGRFSLETTQLPQATVWVPIERLQEAVGLAGKANLLLLGSSQQRTHAEMMQWITAHCALEDYGLAVAEVPLAAAVEIRSARIFLDRQVAAAIQTCFPTAQPVITYLANTIAANGRATPYSMVTAVNPQATPFWPAGSNGAVLNAWEAEDLGVAAGDRVRIDYYALDGGRTLVERSSDFPVAAVVPLVGLAADRLWMPDFPGVAAAAHTADWEPGVPIDFKRIRPKDEAYWDAHRGTPKVFIPLEIGREMFGNRWGEYTAMRVPVASREQTAARLLAAMTPATAGLVLRDVGPQGLAAAASPVDFAGLFLGMSLFLMAAAVALTAMMFRFHIELRNRESGLLAALGIPANKIVWWRLGEGLCVVTAGSVLGALLAVGYSRWLLGFLASLWSGPGGRSMFRFHAEPATLVGGIAGFVVLMMGVIWQVTRQQSRRTVSLRLAAGTEEVVRARTAPVPWWAAGFAALGLCALGGTAWLGTQGAFFLAGCAFLLAGIACYRWVLRRRVVAAAAGLSPRRMAELNCGRRPTRSMVVVGTLACGVFLVVAVASFRKHGGDEWRQRGSGAGGFAWWVETTRPPDHGGGTAAADVLDLGSARRSFGQVLPMRIGPGDDASCFNLNQVARPRMLAVDAALVARLGAFPVKQVMAGCEKNWSALSGGEVARAFVDETTLLWVLKKKLGERLIYQDEWGREFPVEIAGTLDATVFQGSMIVDEARFLQHYPSAEGPRLFLVESGADAEGGGAILQQSLADLGAQVTSTRERLAAFHGVENTYISIFQVLGGLGVIVGSAGLGLVTARNLLERQHEFAILHALGIPDSITRRIVRHETAQFIRWGLGIGMTAAMVAILPALAAGGGTPTLAWTGLLIVGIASAAALGSWLGRAWAHSHLAADF
jgi:hypothetical protein